MTSQPAIPDLAEIEARMRPGQFSQGGFLGASERLADIIESDAATLAVLGLTHVALADALEALVDAAVAARGRRARVGALFDASVVAFTGFQICPWALDPDHGQCQAGGGVRNASIDWTIRNRQTGATLRGPGLIVHLIRAHHFFEGRQSPYRVDPAALAALLGLR